MALFNTNVNHPLYSCCLPHVTFYLPNMKSPVLFYDMPKMKENRLRPYSGNSILTFFQKIKRHMWELFWKVLHHCVSFTVHLNTSVFLMCAREMVAMKEESKKRALGSEAQDGPGWESRTGEPTSDPMVKKSLDPRTKSLQDPVIGDVTKPDKFAQDGHDVMLSYWLESEMSDEDEEDDGDSEEDEENSAPEDDEEPEWSEEEDSDWSDVEEDSEMSTESTELWESFINTSDPYNPLYFSSSTGVETKTLDVRESTPASGGATHQHPTPTDTVRNLKEGSKKVRFTEEVTVRHLVAWTFASRAARDGSCWLQLARDRDRFRRRVEQVGEVISPCLTAEHRARVWERLQRGF
ncbi:protein phosphatase 1 regulatory subunit 15A [Brachyhypopomus gauderio]|uniref:protein phosphatase 1 regulatory subunit 15A n=1 Tax=Brachyhypopomus gauderio TaxID=698409 RepID=UPI00404366D6